MPQASEAAYPGWRLIGYRADHGSRNVYFAYVVPSPDHVSLGFEWNILLPDPLGLLAGDGSQVRYIRCKHLEEIQPEPKALLIRQSLEVAALSRDQKQQRLLEREVLLGGEIPLQGISE